MAQKILYRAKIVMETSRGVGFALLQAAETIRFIFLLAAGQNIKHQLLTTIVIPKPINLARAVEILTATKTGLQVARETVIRCPNKQIQRGQCNLQLQPCMDFARI